MRQMRQILALLVMMQAGWEVSASEHTSQAVWSVQQCIRSPSESSIPTSSSESVSVCGVCVRACGRAGGVYGRRRAAGMGQRGSDA